MDLLYLRLEGELQVDYFRPDGNQAVFSFETPFSVIGDIELFENCQVLSNVQVLKNCLTFVSSAKTIRRYGYDDPQFLRFIMHYLFKKMYFSSTLLSQTPFSVEYRLSRYLLYRMEKDGKIINLEKRESLAAMLGTSTRQLNRIMKLLMESGAIDVHNKTLIITEPQLILAVVEKET